MVVRHFLENVDFVNLIVFLWENNVFHGSEGSKKKDFSCFVQPFFGKESGIDFSLISGAMWSHLFDLLASFFDTCQASILRFFSRPRFRQR